MKQGLYCSCVSKGVLVSDEDLRRTFLQPEQQEDNNVDGFRHPDLPGNNREEGVTLVPAGGRTGLQL